VRVEHLVGKVALGQNVHEALALEVVQVGTGRPERKAARAESSGTPSSAFSSFRTSPRTST
jgi:hypothetical protein